MSQKGQGEKPPVPPPPRRPRTSTPPTATTGDVTQASEPFPTPAGRRHRGAVEPEPPTASSRITRPVSPPLVGSMVPGAKAPSPRAAVRDMGPGGPAPVRAVRDSSRRASIPDSGPTYISSRVPRPVSPPLSDPIGPGTKVTPPRATIRDIGSGGPAPGKALPDSGPSSSPEKIVRASSHVPSPRSGGPAPGKALPDSGPSSSPEKIVRATSHVTSRRASTRDTGPSTSARASSMDSRPRETLPAGERRSSPRISLPTSSPQKTTGPSPRITFQEAGPSTSARSVKLAASATDASKEPSAKKRLTIFKKKKTDTTEASPERRSAPQRRRTSVSGQNRAKTNRILYSTDEEVRDALVEFSVFIIFLILTSLVTLSVRHSYMFYFNDTMKKLFTTRELVIAPSVTVCFEKLITVPDWWDYLVYNFLITLHGDLTFLDGNDTAPAPVVPPSDKKPEEKPEEKPEGKPEGKPEEKPKGKPEGDYDDEEDDDDKQKLIEKTPRVDATLDELLKKSPYNWDPGVDWVAGARVVREARAETYDDRGNGSTSHHLEGRVFLYENLLLGPPRLRQIRVRRESCYVNDAFIRYFNTCYAAYSSAAEERNANYHGSPYRTMNDLDTTPLWTVLAFYRSGGYVVDLTYEKNKNLAIITDLKDSHWLDRGSRLCLVEFNLFNENTDIFQSVKLIAEIPPTGGVIPQAHLQTVKQYSFFTDRSMVMTVIYIFWYIMIVYYTIYEIIELRKSGCKNYFFSMLNILDCIILLLCYLALVYNVWHTFKVQSVTNKAEVELTYQSLDVLCFWNIIYVDMMAILAFLVWIKIFKFISFNKTLVQFTTTLKRCSKDLAGFSLMFGIVFLAYAQLGLLLFGTKHPDFRNFITSILTMIRMILGDFQYNLIEQANRVLGPIYFLTYILLVFFILLNMFLAIIMETYNTVKSEITQGRSHLGSYIYKKLTGLLYLITHCGRKRRPRPEPTAEEAAEAEQEAKAAQEEPEEIRKNLTPAEAKYFQEIPPGDNKELVRLNNRVGLLEEILEKLITNMDDILKRVERERSHKKK